MPESRRRTRDRNLAKHAAKRQLERMRAARRRRIAFWAATVAAVLALSFVGSFFVFKGGGGNAASSTPTGPSASVKPGTQTGTVTPTPPTTSQVACGGSAPADADAPKPQYAGPPPNRIDAAKTYVATIRTSCGEIVVRLNAKRAPDTVNSFVFLARKRFFDGMRFGRVVASTDLIQAGSPFGTTEGGPGYQFDDELNGKITYTPGTVAMANRGPNTNGSQFFVITGPQGTNLDGSPNYAIFGRVVKGLDVAKRINALVPASGDGAPTKNVYVESIRITQKAVPSPSPSPSATPTASPS